MNLERVAEDLWVRQVPYRAGGLWLGRQLVVARLPDGSLWVHSPIPWGAAEQAALGQLGRVTQVVGPNRLHDECLEEFQAAYPDATFHAAPGLAEDRPDLYFAAPPLGSNPRPEWAATFDQHLVEGMPKMNEVVFLHRATGSLILADLAFNLGPEGPWLTRTVMRLNGAWNRFGPSRLCCSLMADRAAVRRSIEHLLSWDFDRVIVGHGRNLETGGNAALRAAFAFLF